MGYKCLIRGTRVGTEFTPIYCVSLPVSCFLLNPKPNPQCVSKIPPKTLRFYTSFSIYHLSLRHKVGAQQRHPGTRRLAQLLSMRVPDSGALGLSCLPTEWGDEPCSQLRGAAFLYGINRSLHYCWNSWEVAEGPGVLKKWVLKNKQGLAYAG